VGLVEWAYVTSREVLAHALPRRWSHVQSVADEAQRIAGIVNDDGDVLAAAALLHDVGYGPDIAVTGFHPLDGARYLAGLGVDHRLCCLVARHSCAIREAEMRGLRAEVEQFEDEATLTRDALWYCDMVTGPNGERVLLQGRLDEIQRRYGPDDLVSRFIRSAQPELAAAVERTGERMLAVGVDQASCA
jgi:HD superfamily phosphodiesterase